MKLSICAETVLRRLPFEQRIAEICGAGFEVEFWRWADHDVEAIARVPGARISCFVANYGGSMVHPDGAEALIQGVRRSIAVAEQLGCREMILLTGDLGPKGAVIHAIADSPIVRWATAYRTLHKVAELAEKHGVWFNLEHLNTKLDHPGYPLARPGDAAELTNVVGSARVRVLLDLYHAQVQEGNLAENIKALGPAIGYVHVADVPGRHEPGTGEINYPRVAQALREVGYTGTAGLEALPHADDFEAMERFRQVFG